ncbi:MAG: AraC family transcriptional regulator [Armatimonadota bacterium]
MRKYANCTFSLSIEIGGIVNFDIEPTNSSHQHPYWEICLVRSGTGEYVDGGEVFPLSTGSLFASAADHPHEIRSFQTRDLSLFFVSFTQRNSATSTPSDEDRLLGAFFSGHQTLRQDCNDLLALAEITYQASSSTVRQALAKAFTLAAMSRLTFFGSEMPTSEPSLDVARAVRFIEANCTQRVTVDDVAHHLGTASRTLQRRFCNEIGHGVAKEIRIRKMRRAAHLLLMGYPLQEVGESVGVPDPGQFSTAFLVEFGKRPKQFQIENLRGLSE